MQFQNTSRGDRRGYNPVSMPRYQNRYGMVHPSQVRKYPAWLSSLTDDPVVNAGAPKRCNACKTITGGADVQVRLLCVSGLDWTHIPKGNAERRGETPRVCVRDHDRGSLI